MTEDKEVGAMFAAMEDEWQEQKEQRRKVILRNKIPDNRDLLTALLSMTKQELDDIRYNLCVTGISSLKKAEMAAALVPAVVDFAKRWLVTIGIEQYNILTSLCRSNGLSTQLDPDDMRLDYMRCLGIIFYGQQDGKVAWYMPDEILAVYTKLDHTPDYKKAVTVNDEVMRLTGGLLFYYGCLNYDELYQRVKNYLDQDVSLSFVDFMGVLMNGGCWHNNVINTEDGMHYYTLMDADKMLAEREKKAELDFADFPYDQIYEAGDPNYIDATDEYKAFAQYLMNAFSLDVLDAADIVGEIYILLQNGESMQEIISYLERFGFMKEEKTAAELMEHYTNFALTSKMWSLKGHSPAELEEIKIKNASLVPKKMKNNVVKFVPRSSTVGRNDPCPCGSGKKYKKCCLHKDLNDSSL